MPMKNTPNELGELLVAVLSSAAAPACTVMTCGLPAMRVRLGTVQDPFASRERLSTSAFTHIISSRRSGSIGFVLIGVLRRCLVPARSDAVMLKRGPFQSRSL
jgi:hypothetical protein